MRLTDSRHDATSFHRAPRARQSVIEIVVADITTLEVDAVVNAANGALRGGGGVDGAIHRASGPQLMTELKLFPGCPTGEAVRTRAYKMPSKYVIHAVGPIWRGGGQSEPALLARAYESSFARAKDAGDIRTIAFPAISTGVYRFPKYDAARIALTSMLEHEWEYSRIVACLFDDDDAQTYRDTLASLRRAR
jgi:O-acetyl-ADP-ribose deacetylase (regulator of RNase III)